MYTSLSLKHTHMIVYCFGNSPPWTRPEWPDLILETTQTPKKERENNKSMGISNSNSCNLQPRSNLQPRITSSNGRTRYRIQKSKKMRFKKSKSNPRCPTFIHVAQIVYTCSLLKKMIYLLRYIHLPAMSSKRAPMQCTMREILNTDTERKIIQI